MVIQPQRKVRFLFVIFAVLLIIAVTIFFIGRNIVRRMDFVDIHQTFYAVCSDGDIFEVEVDIRHYRTLHTVRGTIVIDGTTVTLP